MKWVSILGNISIWIILLPFIIGIIRIKQLNRESKIILLVIFVGTIPQVLKPFISNSSFLNVLYNLYTPAEFILYLLLFKRKATVPINRKVILFSFYLFLLFSLFFMFKYGLKDRFINEWVIINNSIQITWICFCLMEFYTNESSVIETTQPFFWFLLGITLYSSGTVVFYSLWYFVKSDLDIQKDLIKSVHHFFNILLYIFFSIGLWKNHVAASHSKKLIEAF